MIQNSAGPAADDVLAAAQRLVRRETVVNLAVSAVLAAFVGWLIFRGDTALVALAPPLGGVFGIVPGTFNFTLLVTLGLSMVIRKRVRAGAAPLLDASHAGTRWARLPQPLSLRALTLAVLATLTFVPLTLLLVRVAIGAGLLPAQWSFAGMLGFFVVYFVLLTWAVTPIVVWRALLDR